MQYKVTKLTRYTSSKGGAPFPGNATKLSLLLEGVDGFVGLLDKGAFTALKVGDYILGSIEEKGGYKNFVPESESKAPVPQHSSMLASINDKLDRLIAFLMPDKVTTNVPPEKDDLPF